VPLGSILGIPVRLSVTWLPLAALVTYSYGMRILAVRPDLPAFVGYGVGFGVVAGLVGSVLLHELGHAVSARWFGIPARGITLDALGGATELERDAPKPSVELAVSLAGPLTSLALAVVCAMLGMILPPYTLARDLVMLLALANLVVAVFNALPGLPLDGGRALSALVWAATGNVERGRRVAGWAGQVVAVVTALIMLWLYGVRSTWVPGLVIGLLVAHSIWVGARQAVLASSFVAVANQFQVARLTHPIVAVPPGTPLAEAWQRAESLGQPDAAIAVADPDGRVVGLLHQDAATRVPEDRRPWIAVEALTRRVEPSQVLSHQLSGIDLLRAVRADPGADYLVVDGEDVIGVLRGAELTTLLESSGLVSRRTTQ
jgi:Zn-dependent protease